MTEPAAEDLESDDGRYLPRPRRRSLLMAIAVVWLPCTLPLFGIVNDSAHALKGYATCFAVVPGMIVPTILRLDDFLFGAVAFVATTLVFGSVYIIQRWSPVPFMQIMTIAAAVLLSFAAVGLGHARGWPHPGEWRELSQREVWAYWTEDADFSVADTESSTAQNYELPVKQP